MLSIVAVLFGTARQAERTFTAAGREGARTPSRQVIPSVNKAAGDETFSPVRFTFRTVVVAGMAEKAVPPDA